MSDLLPQGLKFLEIGWWIVHVLAVWLIYEFAYRKGRRDEKKATQQGSSTAPSR